MALRSRQAARLIFSPVVGSPRGRSRLGHEFPLRQQRQRRRTATIIRACRSQVTANPLSAILAWIDRLDSLGLDGGVLSELGLKDSTLVVDDQRNGKRWSSGK